MYGVINVGGSGAVSSFAGGGITNVVKEATAGQYTITMTDKFSRFLWAQAKVVLGSASTTANIQVLETPSTMQADIKSDKTLTIQCLDYAGSAVNPASGAQIMLTIVMRNSSIGPFDTAHS